MRSIRTLMAGNPARCVSVVARLPRAGAARQQRAAVMAATARTLVTAPRTVARVWHLPGTCTSAQCAQCTTPRRTFCTAEAKKPEDAPKAEEEATDATATAAEGDEEVDTHTASLLKDVEELTAALQEKQELVDNTKDQLLRALAENENTITRMRREVDTARKYGVQKFAGNLLDVADNLSRAMNSVPEDLRSAGAEADEGSKQLENLFVGVKMTDAAMHKAFGSVGLAKFDAMGQEIDPMKHDVKFNMPESPEVPAGTVGAIIRDGYMLEDRVLRAAEVGAAPEA